MPEPDLHRAAEQIAAVARSISDGVRDMAAGRVPSWSIEVACDGARPWWRRRWRITVTYRIGDVAESEHEWAWTRFGAWRAERRLVATIREVLEGGHG